MNISLTVKRLLFMFSLLLFSMATFAQLPDFTLTVTPTAQTCLGNGVLGFSVSGVNPSANIDYTIYLLPDTATPVGITTSSTYNNLQAGDYMVVATQSLSGQSNTQTQNVTIDDETVELTYLFELADAICGNDGRITVNVTSGTAVSYEIFAGPVTRPLQVSNVFNNLPAGLYQVRVHDICGDAVVVSVQLVQLPPGLIIGEQTNFSPDPLPDCNTITISHVFGPPAGYALASPISFTYTLYPPGGGTPVIVTPEIEGSSEVNIPFYNGQEYSYDITAVDACGNVYTLNDIVITPAFTGIGIQEVFGCDGFTFGFQFANYMEPFSIEFLSAPDGFIPSDFSTLHPNFNTVEDIEYGSESNPVPVGEYSVAVTDGCGHVAIIDFELEIPELDVSVVTQSVGCEGVSIELEVPTRLITEATLLSAPVGYPETLPEDLETYITDEGKVLMTDVQFGVYVFEVTDSCGFTYTKEVLASPSSFNVSVEQRPGCDEGYGSVKVEGVGTDLTMVVIESAPSAFTQATPYDVTFNLSSNGNFYMNSLPEGEYVFTFMNTCEGTISVDITVEGYHKTVNSYTLTENCGSFELNIQNASNGVTTQQFWLQKYYPQTGDWGHPQTGELYDEGVPPVADNSLVLINNANNINLAFSGQFRIVKSFYTYSNGISTNFKCFEVLHEFYFMGGPKILDIYSFPCDDGLAEVAVMAEGIPPLAYSIIQKDGEPFTVDNGESNVFSELEAAVYTMRVTDECGNFRTAQIDINEADPIEIEASGLCDGQNGLLSVPPFSFLNYEWYNGDDPDTILSTSSTLEFTPFNESNDTGTYYVRISTSNPVSCMNQTLEYVVVPSSGLNAGDDSAVLYCNDGQAVNLEAYLSNPHDEDGIWIDMNGTGALADGTLDIAGLPEGVYEFKYMVTGMCNAADEAVITFELRDIPEAPQVAPLDGVCEGEMIQLTATDVPNAVYEWTGPNGFTASVQNPAIESVSIAAAGIYEVRAVVNGCASNLATVNVNVRPLPQFELQGDATLCEGQEGLLSVIAANFDEAIASYQWYYDDALLNGVTAADIAIYETGVYRVEVSNEGCVTEESFNVTENNDAFEVILDNGCIDFEYGVWVTNADELDGYLFNWTGPEGYNAAGTQIIISEMPAGIYTVEVTNPDGCSVTASVNIENTYCRIPKGISPGDDDFNNEFDLSNLGVQNLKIFNRYGLKVYDRDGYLNEWHGQSDKGELPTGTYYYVATLSAGKQVTGWVYLQRRTN
ncbi:T9SS type B sorting domain-containing protein [Flavobacterium beibuense]|nr:gliding motility-associated C-terminal domain-containing protein [Flavobacterium beibuense]